MYLAITFTVSDLDKVLNLNYRNYFLLLSKDTRQVTTKLGCKNWITTTKLDYYVRSVSNLIMAEDLIRCNLL